MVEHVFMASSVSRLMSRIGIYSTVIEHVLSMCKVMGSIPTAGGKGNEGETLSAR